MVPQNKYLIIWNEPCPYPLSDEVEIISPVNAVAHVLDRKYIGLIILCELNQDDDGNPVKMQELYGISLVQRFRMNNVEIPIVFTSFLSKSYLVKSRTGAILTSLGHGFIRLPLALSAFTEALQSMEPLHELELDDIRKNYCSEGGTARMLLHSLDGLKRSEFTDETSLRIREVLERLHLLFGQGATLALSEFDSWVAAQQNVTTEKAVDHVAKIGDELLQKYAPNEAFGSKSIAHGSWKLLLLDDEISDNHPLVKELKIRGIRVICTTTVQEAKRKLSADFKGENKIMMVVSDYRLEELDNEGLKVHQPIQGYRFLRDVSFVESYLLLVALSALPRRFLMHSFKHYGVRVDVFSKKDYLESESTMSLLCDELVEMGNENFEVRTIRLPRMTADRWKLFEPFYRVHRLSVDYLENEKHIANQAREYCEGIKIGTIPFQLKGYTTELKGTTKTPGNSKAFHEFLDKLIARRVSIWYSQYNKTATLTDILMVLMGYFDKEIFFRVVEKAKSQRSKVKKKKANSSGTNLEIKISNEAKFKINTVLALSLTEYPWNMTIEEKHWMIYEMGFGEIAEREERELVFLNQASRKLKTWFDESKTYKKLISETEPNTFQKVRELLRKVIVDIHNHRELVDSVIKLISNLKAGIHNTRIESLLSFEKFLKLILNRLKRIRNLPLEQDIPDSEWAKLQRRVVGMAIKKLGEKRKYDIEASAILVLSELRRSGKTYSNDLVYLNLVLEDYYSLNGSDWRTIDFDNYKKRTLGSDSDDYFSEFDT